jgi:hypothetical protein
LGLSLVPSSFPLGGSVFLFASAESFLSHFDFQVVLEIEVYDGDQGTTLKDLLQVPIGPVTRAQAKKFKDVLNGLIQELWVQANSWRPIEHDPRGQQRIVTLIQVLEGSGQG